MHGFGPRISSEVCMIVGRLDGPRWLSDAISPALANRLWVRHDTDGSSGGPELAIGEAARGPFALRQRVCQQVKAGVIATNSTSEKRAIAMKTQQ